MNRIQADGISFTEHRISAQRFDNRCRLYGNCNACSIGATSKVGVGCHHVSRSGRWASQWLANIGIAQPDGWAPLVGIVIRIRVSGRSSIEADRVEVTNRFISSR